MKEEEEEVVIDDDTPSDHHMKSPDCEDADQIWARDESEQDHIPWHFRVVIEEE